MSLAAPLTPDSEWRPPMDVLAALPYGGNLQEATRSNDREAVRLIQEAWGMPVLASDQEIAATLNAPIGLPVSRLPSRQISGTPEERAQLAAAIAASLQDFAEANKVAAAVPAPASAPSRQSSGRMTDEERAMLDAAIALSLQQDPSPQDANSAAPPRGAPAADGSLVGSMVTLHSLTGRPELNGMRGTARSYDAARARYEVSVGEQNLSIRPENLARAALSDAGIARELHDREVARDLEHRQREEWERAAACNFTCPVCMEPKPVDGSFTATCDHRLCGDCIYDHICSKLEPDEGAPQTSEQQLRCVECPEPLTPQQILAVLETYRRNDLAQTFLDNRLNEVARTGPFCSCPRCKTVHVPSVESERAHCTSCDHPFCSKCAAPRYHFFHAGERNTPDCAGLMREKEAAWLQWRAQGQAAYVERLAQVDAEYAQQLRAQNEDAESSRRAYEAFQADEAAKSGWVHCPHCNVAWSGSDACSHVTCGVLDATMGGRRATVGCGRQFDLREGIPYRPVQAPPPQPAAAAHERPATVTHESVACDKCGTSPIQGVRIRCLHCPSYTLCLLCLARDGPDHDAEEEWPGREEAPHIFEVLHEPLPIPH